MLPSYIFSYLAVLGLYLGHSWEKDNKPPLALGTCTRVANSDSTAVELLFNSFLCQSSLVILSMKAFDPPLK